MRYTGALVALALCAGCGGSTAGPSTAPLSGGYIGTSPASATNTFEYVTGAYQGITSIFDYPKSDKQIGSMKTNGSVGCTNVLYGYGKDTFWIVESNKVVEYRVLKKRVRSLSISTGYLSGCAMSRSGDLAVGILDGSHGGGVMIFKHARGAGKLYSSGLSAGYFLGYDQKGDLFADGFNAGNQFALVELPRGGTAFHSVTVSNSVLFPGAVQWDGTYLDITDQESSVMYQYAVQGTTATLQGTVSLSGSSDCAQTWIAVGVVYCADAGNNSVAIYPYPAGGSPIASLAGTFDLPLGIIAVEKSPRP